MADDDDRASPTFWGPAGASLIEKVTAVYSAEPFAGPAGEAERALALLMFAAGLVTLWSGPDAAIQALRTHAGRLECRADEDREDDELRRRGLLD